LVLVRHGESQINALNRQTRIFCGQFETPLTVTGREQAREAGKRIANHDSVKIQFVASSCHERARDTASLIATMLPYPVSCLPPHSGLNERSLGSFEGRAEAEVFSEYPHYRDDERLRGFQNDFVQKAPGGENLAEVTSRAWSAVEQLLTETHGDILLVSHFNTIRCILGRALELTRPEILQLRVKNARPIVLQCGARFQLAAGEELT
jgi:broad specificity phosphatase PhoE